MMNSIKKLLKQTALYRLYYERKYDEYWKRLSDSDDSYRGPIIERHIKKNGVGAELGVLKGTFTNVLLHRLQPKELHLIDPWYMLSAEWDWKMDYPSTIDALRDILKRFKKEIEDRKVFVHVRDDVQALREFPDHYFDWVYLDSSHRYDHTVAELEVLRHKVKPDGIISGDDWRADESHIHHGVYKAVNEFIAEHGYEIVHVEVESGQWFIRSKR